MGNGHDEHQAAEPPIASNNDSDVEPIPSRSTNGIAPATAGGRAGAVTAALLIYGVVTIPLTVLGFLPSLFRGSLLLVFFMVLPFALVAALVGFFLGRFVAYFENVWVSACVGVAWSLPVQATYSLLFIPRAAALQTHVELRIVLIGSSIGAAVGAVAWRAAYRNRHPYSLLFWQFSLSEMMVFVAAIAACLFGFVV